MLNPVIFSYTLAALKRSTKKSQANLYVFAENQGGFFTAKQAEQAGFDRTHHTYHVQAGNWQRERRGIFRLSQYPLPERPDLILWSLWSRNREGTPEGVYSHQTALSIYDITDLMPSKLHMTVPIKFRRMAQIPDNLILHYADLSLDQIEHREGYQITRPIRAIVDISQDVPLESLSQAFTEAKTRGLITEKDIETYRKKLPSFLFSYQKTP